jgi:iron complex transport system permease protein
VFLGAIAGGSLAVAGAAFQALLRNPLGDPYALGISGGAALGATVAVMLHWGLFLIPASAFAGALLSAVLVIVLARASSATVDAKSMLLAGIVLNTASSALLALLRTVLPGSQAQQTLSLLLGVISEESPSRVLLVGGFSLMGVLALWAQSKTMDLLALGADAAQSLGVSVRRAEIQLFVAASLVVGGVVSVCGLVPFVGLVVPHYVRVWTGSQHRLLIPCCVLAGASLLVLADAVARWTYHWAASEAPVGAITALIGAPFLFVTLRRSSDGALRS